MYKAISKFLLLLITILISCNSITKSKEKITVRNAHAMAYSEKENYVLLFGGADEKAVLNETWLLKDTLWEKLAGIDAPPARTFGSMVYDDADNRFILFGGNTVLFGGDTLGNRFLLDDTWEFRNGQWTAITTTHKPGKRAEAAIAYDKERKKVILFGGYQFSEDGNSYIKLNDTWEFDGKDWTMVAATGPSPRNGAAMVYDAAKKITVLYGGNMLRTQKDSANFNGVSWVWNGQEWTHNPINLPLIFNAAIAYNADDNSALLFGGYKNGERLNDTWSLTDTAKQYVTTLAPPARNHAVMVYNSKAKAMVLFGGHDGENVFGDMWQFADNKWVLINNTSSLKRTDNKH